MRVCTTPDPSGVAYVRMLYTGVRATGVEVERLTVRRLVAERWDIVHLHWPEWQLRERPYARLVVRAALLLGGLQIARIRGARLVWTVHNVDPHEPTPPRFSRLYWSVFTRMVDGVISLHDAAVPALRARHPRLAERPTAVIPQGLYVDTYPDDCTRAEARERLRLPDEAVVLTSFGLIRRYKGVPEFVRAFRASRDPGAVLLVAGEPFDDVLRAEIEEAAGDDARVRLELRRIPDDEVQYMMRASDALVLPYLRSSNSAVALLALTFDTPIVAPSMGAFPELANECGADWVRLYSPPVTSAVVDAAIARAADTPGTPPDLSGWDWAHVGRSTVEFYERLRSSGAPSAS